MKTNRNLSKNVIYKTFICNINQKLIIWSQGNIITKFGQKKYVSLVLGKVYENYPKFKEKF